MQTAPAQGKLRRDGPAARGNGGIPVLKAGGSNTWPTVYAGFSYAGYTVQSTANIGSSAVWSTNSPRPVVIGGQNVVINTNAGTQQFLRLIK